MTMAKAKCPAYKNYQKSIRAEMEANWTAANTNLMSYLKNNSGFNTIDFKSIDVISSASEGEVRSMYLYQCALAWKLKCKFIYLCLSAYTQHAPTELAWSTLAVDWQERLPDSTRASRRVGRPEDEWSTSIKVIVRHAVEWDHRAYAGRRQFKYARRGEAP